MDGITKKSESVEQDTANVSNFHHNIFDIEFFPADFYWSMFNLLHFPFFIYHVLLECSSMVLELQKTALEMKKYLECLLFCPKELNCYGLELKVQEVEFRVLNSFQ